MKNRDSVSFTVNGSLHEVRGTALFLPLADYLRYNLGLTGTKIVCAEGDCGACTVLKAYAQTKDRLQAINSCIALVAQMDGSHIVTVEGVKQGCSLSPVQKAMMDCHGSQCGYCTPGFVMALSWMFDRHGLVDEQTIKNHLTGNLCRCTGYQPIIDGALKAAGACKVDELSKRYLTNPPALPKTPIHAEVEERVFLAPTTLLELKKMRAKFPHSIILGAATDLGVQYNKGKHSLEHLISLHLISELYHIKVQAGKMRVGARVTLAELRKHLPEELAKILDLFASPQIKNVATLVGNVANASPIADTPPFLLALGATVEILGKKGKREVPLEDFYIGYKKTKLTLGDVITAIHFPLPKKAETLKFYKNSQRKDLDISSVNAALWMKKKQDRIEDIRLAYGGVGPIPLRLKKVEAVLRGSRLEPEKVERAIEALHQEITPISDIRGTAAYRHVLAENILRKLL